MHNSAVSEPPSGPATPMLADSRPRRSHEGVAAQVMAKLGRVPGHTLTRAIPLWAHFYRVNVYVRNTRNDLVTCHEIRHSFFVATDDAGVIVSSQPEI